MTTTDAAAAADDDDDTLHCTMTLRTKPADTRRRSQGSASI